MGLDSQRGMGNVLADVQNSEDDRHIAIDSVGVRGVKFPIDIRLRTGQIQRTNGLFTLLVDLPERYKGTHMSRFLEALGEQVGAFDARSMKQMLGALQERLRSKVARADIRFTLFLERAAPVSGKVGLMGYECGYVGSTQPEEELTLLVACPVSTLCPCSKEISAYGAHNQRGTVSVRVQARNNLWFEDLIEMIEQSGSSPLYPILKREDEKYVTEHAYDNPRFVEDVVREVAIRFDACASVGSYEVEVENNESIHDHNAYASIRRSK